MTGCILQVAADHLFSMNEILYWVGAASAIIALAATIILPLRKMLNKYNAELKTSQDFIVEQSKLNEQYQELIFESQHDRQKLNADIAAIKTATLTQIKLEINKICDRAIARGFVYSWECEIVEMLYEAYVPLGGNSNTKAKVLRMRKMEVKYGTTEDDYEQSL